MIVNTVRFKEVCEAFDILSNVELRAIYDKYGDFGLREGLIVDG